MSALEMVLSLFSLANVVAKNIFRLHKKQEEMHVSPLDMILSLSFSERTEAKTAFRL